MGRIKDYIIEQEQHRAEYDAEQTGIDISRTELPNWLPRTDDSPVVWVATRLVAVVGEGNASVISEVVGVSRDRVALLRLAGGDHTVSIEAVEMTR